MARRTSRKARSPRRMRAMYRSGTAVMIAGIICVGIWIGHGVIHTASLRFSSDIPVSYISRTDAIHLPDFIIFGNRSIPVVEADKVSGVWSISPVAANHVRLSAYPGTPGNIIIYAHNTDSLFGPLVRAHIGDEVQVRTKDGGYRRYVVVRTAEVSPENTALLQPTTTETLTLYTCSGFLDSRRFVLRAVPR